MSFSILHIFALSFFISIGALMAESQFPYMNDVGELIEFWGFPYESHEVTTEDGYVLNVHRGAIQIIKRHKNFRFFFL
jgi:hypothetical protein